MDKHGDLFFKDSFDNRRLVFSNCTETEAMLKISEFCKERKFKIYYIRKWSEGNEVHFDVGSHSEFFIWVEYGAV